MGSKSPTTPFGTNARYLVRFHVVGEDLREDGSVRGVDRHREIPVVTPLGEARAIALAAIHFSSLEPRSLFREVNIAGVENDFVVMAEDLRDRESYGR